MGPTPSHRPPISVPDVPKIESATVMSSALICPGGCGSVRLFTTALGQPLPHLDGSTGSRQAVLDFSDVFPVQTGFTTNMCKAGELGGRFVAMRVSGLWFDTLGRVPDIAKVLDCSTYRLKISGVAVADGSVRDTPRDLDPAVHIGQHDSVEMSLDIGSNDRIDIDEPVLVRAILVGTAQMDVR